MKRLIGTVLGVALVLSASAQAVPTIVNKVDTVDSNVVYMGQLVTTLNTDASDDAQLYLEKASYQLTAPLTLTSGGTLPAGTWVSSYILSFDLNSAPPNNRATADITFDTTVLGLIYDTTTANPNLKATDGTLGLGTSYYDSFERKLELSDGAVPGSADTVSFSGNTVSVSLYGKVNPDDVRIVTAPIPVPGAMLLAGLGTALVGWIRNRRRLS